jgi:Carboxypeptidase regulatory-like domain
MMRKLFSIVVAAFVVTAAWGLRPAFAQNYGTIVGHVYDQSGTPLRGVTVTATSPTQIGGAITTVTNDEGGFRLQGLFPGKFKVTLTAPKLRTTVHENVQVVAARAVELDLIMDVETVAEEVKIIQRAPMVNQGSTNVGVTFDEDFMNALPLPTRDYQGVAALAPGVTNAGGGQAKVRGGTYFSNKYTVDGFNTTDPVTRTFGTNFSFNSMANVEVTTAGSGAEGADTSGGIINIVTKSGSNRFEVTASGEYTDQNLQFFKDNLDRGGSNRLATASLYVGGPIIRDKLWYALSGQFVDVSSTLQADPNFPSHPSYHTYGFDGTMKLTWRATQRNQIDLLATVSPASFNNLLQDPLVEAEAEARQFQRSEFLGLTWQYTGEIFFISRVGYKQQEINVGPQRCEWDENCETIPARIDLVTGIQRENYQSQNVSQRRSVEFSGQSEWIKDSRKFGGHQLKFTWLYQAMKQDRRVTVPGDVIFSSVGADPFARTTFCSNDPTAAEGACSQNFLRTAVTGQSALLTLGDAWKPTRYLTIKPGVSFHYGASENDRGVQVTDMTAFNPHLSVMWDPTRDGKTKLQASFDGIADTGFLALASFTSRQLYQQRCSWDPTTQSYSRNCRASGGSGSQTVGLPCGPTGVRPDGSSCATKLETPRVWESTLGAEREIATGVAAGVTFVYRRFVNQWEDVETNANWNEGGTDLRREGQFKTNRSQFVFDLQTPEESRRSYRGVTVQLRKREGRLKGLLAYTLSKYEGTVDADFASTFLDNPPNQTYWYGALPGDSRHDLRALATYEILPWLSGGVSYMFYSGGPYNHYFYDPVYGSYSRFQAQRGYDPRGNNNPEDDLELRLPDISQLGLQARASLERLTKQKISIFADLLNILALRTPTSYIQQDGPFFGRVASRLPATRVRLGIEYRY